MERPAKRMRMSLSSTQHPVAVLLDDAFRAYFATREAKKRPIAMPQPFNAQAWIKQHGKRYARAPAKIPDAGVYAKLPCDLQGLVRKFTPHPVSLLIRDAHNLWNVLSCARVNWISHHKLKFERALRLRESTIKVMHFNWLQDHMVFQGAWDRSGVTWADSARYDDELDPY